MHAFSRFAFLCLASGFLFAEPKLVFEEMSYDFGTVPQGTRVSHLFTVTNTSENVIEITRLDSRCDCLQVSASKKSIRPNETATLNLVLDTTFLAGRQAHPLKIASTDPGRPLTTIVITGKVEKLLDIRPLTVSLKKVKRDGEPIEKIVTLKATKADLELPVLERGPGWMNVKEKRIGKREIQLIVTIDPKEIPDESPLWKSEFRFRPNIDTLKEIRIGLEVEIDEPYVVVPKKVAFKNAVHGEVLASLLHLRTVDGKSFKVKDVKHDLPKHITLVKPEGSSDKQKISIMLKEDAPKGEFKGTITVTTDNKNGKTVVVPIGGNIQ